MGSNKRNELIRKAKQSVRQPDASRLMEEPPKGKAKGRQMLPMSISFFPEDIQWMDKITNELKRMIPGANRSLVVRQALLRLKDDLDRKNPNEVVNDFLLRQTKKS